ncbi:MAG: PD-(D/E)XK nuclease family protein [Candidatus Ancillula sp.]|jgi:putative RecB family exonuclease|nr:PD-(D/E)XK nuclease family protein [Candidatus Ancillula sp.]
MANVKKFNLSPSKVKDFMQCPLMYKFKVVDQLSSPPGIDALRGTHTHAVLEELFKLKSADRTVENAYGLIEYVWPIIMKKNATYYSEVPEVSQIENDAEFREKYHSEIRGCIDNYFKLENPAKLNMVTAQEKWVQTDLDDKAKLGGFIDRVEESDVAGVRISDYKTGKTPTGQFSTKDLFQMMFYSLIWAKEHKGDIPKQVKLLYLKDGGVIADQPNQKKLDEVEANIKEIWAKIQDAQENNEWTSCQSKLCDYCNFKPICPEFGGSGDPKDYALAQVSAEPQAGAAQKRKLTTGEKKEG